MGCVYNIAMYKVALLQSECRLLNSCGR
jgi:hypothetical protein